MGVHGYVSPCSGGSSPERCQMGRLECGRIVGTRGATLTHSFAGDPSMEALHVFLLQEIITDLGLLFVQDEGWVVIHGKNVGDWRGTAIAYRDRGVTHSKTHLLPGGIATFLTLQGEGKSIGHIAGHIPRHATIEQTARISGAWASVLSRGKVVLGFDANETFTDPDGDGWRAHTGRGETTLAELGRHALTSPDQQLTTPTYHPYNTAQRARRLD